MPRGGVEVYHFSFLTSAVDGVGFQHHAPAALPPGKRPRSHCVGGWVGPRAGLDGCGKSPPTGIQSPDSPAHININEHNRFSIITLILRCSRTGTVWFYTSTSNKRAARPKLYTKTLTRDLKLMYSCFTLVRISIKL